MIEQQLSSRLQLYLILFIAPLYLMFNPSLVKGSNGKLLSEESEQVPSSVLLSKEEYVSGH